jgi:hypothetical protein
MAHYMQKHLSFEKKKDLVREYFFYPIQPLGLLCWGSLDKMLKSPFKFGCKVKRFQTRAETRAELKRDKNVVALGRCFSGPRQAHPYFKSYGRPSPDRPDSQSRDGHLQGIILESKIRIRQMFR